MRHVLKIQLSLNLYRVKIQNSSMVPESLVLIMTDSFQMLKDSHLRKKIIKNKSVSLNIKLNKHYP